MRSACCRTGEIIAALLACVRRRVGLCGCASMHYMYLQGPHGHGLGSTLASVEKGLTRGPWHIMLRTDTLNPAVQSRNEHT
jgi:hypothetical protein